MLMSPIRRLALVIFLSPLFASFACKIPDAPGEALNVTTTAAQTELSIDVLGASNTDLAYQITGGWHDAPSTDVQKLATAGWSSGCALPGYQAAIQNKPPDVTVIADVTYNDAGTQTQCNDVGNNDGGYTVYDLFRFTQLLEASPIGSCVVVVLPRHGAGVLPSYATELDEARKFVFDMVTPYGQFTPPAGRHYVIEDWRNRTAVQPTNAPFIGPDGIHISGAPAAEAWQDTMWDGVANCPNV